MAFDGVFYDRLYRDKPYARELVRIIPHLNGTRVLDIGGGTGGHAIILKEKGFEPHILDLSLSMLDIATEKGLSTEHGDIASYKTDRKFDSAIAMFHVLNFCPDLVPVLANIRNVLVDGGTFVFDMWDPTVKKAGAQWRVDGMMTRYSHKRWKGREVFIEFFFPFFLRLERNHLYCSTADEMKRLLTETGFVVEKWEEDGLNFFCIARKL